MTTDQILAAGRNVVSAIAGALVVFGLLKGVDAETIKSQLNVISDAVGKIATAIGLIVPIITATYAALSASRVAQINKVAANPDVTKIIVNNTALASPSVTPSPKVEASPKP